MANFVTGVSSVASMTNDVVINGASSVEDLLKYQKRQETIELAQSIEAGMFRAIAGQTEKYANAVQ